MTTPTTPVGKADVTVAWGSDVVTALGEKVVKAGDTMTGLLTLSGAPTADLHAASKKYVDVLDINTQTGTSFGPVLTDVGKLVTLNNASAITVTVPLNSTIAFPIGAQIHLLQLGAGVVTVTQAGGVTVNATPSKIFRAQFSMATLIKYGTDTWVLVGDT